MSTQSRIVALSGPVYRPHSKALSRQIEVGRKAVEKAFGHPFEKPCRVEVCPDRASFDAKLKAEMSVPEPQRWMVAAGAHDKVVILAPWVWNSDAVEHEHAIPRQVQEIITHELVHVYHA